MSMEGPFLAAIIARLPHPKFNLAAYGVAFSFALIIEAPVIMMMSASTALVTDRPSFIKLRNFTFILNGALTLLLLILLLPPVFYFITENLIGLPRNVAGLTHIAMIILLPWPGAIGYRRFYQGILIRNNLTRRVAYGTIIRISTVISVAFLLYNYSKVDGVVVGATALSCGVLMEGIASRLMANTVLKKVCAIHNSESSNENRLTYRYIVMFYYPLALTPVIALGVHPFLTFFMGQSRFALESLAVFPVVNSLVFIFRSFGLSFQEVAISLMGKRQEGYLPLRKFAIYLGGFATLCLGLIAFTPLADFWFSVVSGLSDELSHFAITPTKILIFIPPLSVLISFQRAILVHFRRTLPITIATVVEFSGIIFVMFLSTTIFDMIGVTAAALALVIGRAAANIYLVPPYHQAFKNNIGG